MLPEKRNVVSPEKFDELFQQEARVIEFRTPEEEAQYEKRDVRFVSLIREESVRVFGSEESSKLFVDDEWWPDHTRRVEIEMRHCTAPFFIALRGLLTGEYKDYRILVSVYADQKKSEGYVGSMALYAERVLIEKILYIYIDGDELNRQFSVRYYLWAISEWEREIAESFPRFSSFKAGSVWKVQQFMRQLSKKEQVILSHGLLKQSHAVAAKYLGENISSEEEALCARRHEFFRIRTTYIFMKQLEASGKVAEAGLYFQWLKQDSVRFFCEPYWGDENYIRSRYDDAFRTMPETFEEKLAARKQAGGKIRFASKRKIRTVMANKFFATFGSECMGPPPSPDQDSEFSFQMKCAGWILKTSFYFGRHESVIEYYHGISSPVTFEHRGSSLSLLGLGPPISFAGWLGISHTQWQYLTNEEVGPACDVVIEHCRHFFEVAPKLLKGLESGV